MKIIKNFLRGFINKKIAIAISVSVVIIIITVVGVRFLSNDSKSTPAKVLEQKMILDSKNNAQNAALQNQMNNPSMGKNINLSGTTTVKSAAMLEQQCVICRSIIKSGTPSSCMKELKCK